MKTGSLDLLLSLEEKQIVLEFDSRCFGFIKLDEPGNENKKNLITKAISSLESTLKTTFTEQNKDEKPEIKPFEPKMDSADQNDVECERKFEKSEEQNKENIENSGEKKTKEEKDCENGEVDAKFYCILGHLNLLVENYPKALSAYQKYYAIDKGHWKDVTFLYGLGIVYFHYHEYQWAITAFQQLLYVEPGFKCANETHIRLGLIFKFNAEYPSSVKHFRLALSDSSPCTTSKFEVRFHIAHAYELQGKYKTAKDAYELLLTIADLPKVVKANTFRQLGWMFHSIETLADTQTRETSAVQYLQKSLDVDNTSGQTWYFLGRCYSSIGKVHDAFVSYRHSIDKSEASADTWCSIGVLYQQQNQPMDALQAYICAVQLDKSHSAAWTDLAILYETVSQPKDALTCYLNSAKNTKGNISEKLRSRITILQENLSQIPAKHLQQKAKTLPSIEEAWSLPIPAELTSRQGATNPHPTSRAGSMGVQQPQDRPMMYGLEGPDAKKIKLEEDGGGAQPPQQYPASTPQPPQQYPASTPPPQVSLNQQHAHMLQYLQQNQCNLTAEQQPVFQQLQNALFVEQHHKQQQQQQRNAQANQNTPFNSHGPSPVHTPQKSASFSDNVPYRALGTSLQDSAPRLSDVTQETVQSGSISQGSQLPELSDSTLIQSVSDQELSDLLALKHNDIATSIAEDLFAQFGDEHQDTKIETSSQNDLTHGQSVAEKSQHSTIDLSSVKTEIVDDSEYVGLSKHDRDLKEWSKRMKQLEERISSSDQEKPNIPPPVSINMSARQILASCKNYGKYGLISNSIMAEDGPPPAPPVRPHPPLPKDKLNPPTPSVYLENKKDAFSAELQQFCMSQPVCVIRGLATALKLDLGLFSTKSLVETNPDHSVEVRTQRQQLPDENVDLQGTTLWKCDSSRSHTTIAKYAQYQASSFQESLREETEKNRSLGKSDNSEDDRAARRKLKTIKFGTNVDLSDEKKWKAQLQELGKLPAFARVVSANNMLSYLNQTILGMNSVQLYMKVPGSRTPGHQENLNFCSVNINIGPGDCEWFGVPEEYWGVVYQLSQKNGLNFLKGSWWPSLEDLFEHNVPVYRFIQKPGDFVWVGAACVHWVQAIGWCNNIAWNTGSLSWKTYQLSVERYEFNKLESYKSIVPLIELSWNIARNVKVACPKLFEQLKYTLARTIKQCQLTIEFVTGLGKQIKWHGRTDKDPAHYCNNCEVEVFNLLFVIEQDRKFVVLCLDCAKKISPMLDKIVVLNQYKMAALCDVYDNFMVGVLNQSVFVQSW